MRPCLLLQGWNVFSECFSPYSARDYATLFDPTLQASSFKVKAPPLSQSQAAAMGSGAFVMGGVSGTGGRCRRRSLEENVLRYLTAITTSQYSNNSLGPRDGSDVALPHLPGGKEPAGGWEAASAEAAAWAAEAEAEAAKLGLGPQQPAPIVFAPRPGAARRGSVAFPPGAAAAAAAARKASLELVPRAASETAPTLQPLAHAHPNGLSHVLEAHRHGHSHGGQPPVQRDGRSSSEGAHAGQRLAHAHGHGNGHAHGHGHGHHSLGRSSNNRVHPQLPPMASGSTANGVDGLSHASDATAAADASGRSDLRLPTPPMHHMAAHLQLHSKAVREVSFSPAQPGGGFAEVEEDMEGEAQAVQAGLSGKAARRKSVKFSQPEEEEGLLMCSEAEQEQRNSLLSPALLKEFEGRLDPGQAGSGVRFREGNGTSGHGAGLEGSNLVHGGLGSGRVGASKLPSHRKMSIELRHANSNASFLTQEVRPLMSALPVHAEPGGMGWLMI